jgi:citrate lyase subunit beta/citryl-CoA lyase
MPLPRSFLYVPANREKFLEKSLGLPADALLFDLEDSVPAAEKQAAREGVRAYAPKVADGRAWVRINGQDTEFAEADLEAVVGLKGLAGIFLPKVENRAEVFAWDAMVGSLEKTRGVAVGTTKLVLSIESALGVLNAYDMAAGVMRVVSSPGSPCDPEIASGKS